MDCPRCGHHFTRADLGYRAHIVVTPWQWYWRMLKHFQYHFYAIIAALLLAWLLIYVANLKDELPEVEKTPLQLA